MKSYDDVPSGGEIHEKSSGEASADGAAPGAAETPSRRRSLGVVKRYLLFVAGFLCVGLGAIGAVVPILPTVPFILLAAMCFMRSSERCYSWLVSNRMFGRPLRNYLERRGVAWRDRIPGLVLLWVVILLSVILLVHHLAIRVLLLLVAVAVSTHIALLKRPERKEDGKTGGDTEE